MRSLCYVQKVKNKKTRDAVQDSPDGGSDNVTRSASLVRLRVCLSRTRGVGVGGPFGALAAVGELQPINGVRQGQELAEHRQGWVQAVRLCVLQVLTGEYVLKYVRM